jgi:hypothetical protein
MFPQTNDLHVNIAAGLGDILLLTVVRGCLVIMPILGISAALSWAGIAVAALAEAAMTVWLAVKAAFLYQLASGRRFLVADTGVALHVPTLLAAELLSIFMSWFLFALVWVNRSVMRQPAAADSAVALARSAALQQLRQRMAVQQWVSNQEPAEVGPELTAPLLSPQSMAPAEGMCAVLTTRDADVDDSDSFLSARSRQASGSWRSAGSPAPAEP